MTILQSQNFLAKQDLQPVNQKIELLSKKMSSVELLLKQEAANQNQSDKDNSIDSTINTEKVEKEVQTILPIVKNKSDDIPIPNDKKQGDEEVFLQ